MATITIHPRRAWSSFRYYLTDIYKGNRVTMLEVHERGDDERRQPTRRICTTTRGNAALLQRLADALNAYNSFEEAHWNPNLDWDDDTNGAISAERKELKAEVTEAENAIDELNEIILADERKGEDEQKEVK